MPLNVMAAIDSSEQLYVNWLVHLIFFSLIPHLEPAFSTNIASYIYIAGCFSLFVYLVEFFWIIFNHIILIALIGTCLFVSKFLPIPF